MQFKYSKDDLKRLQALPLEDKIALSKLRIAEAYEHWSAFVDCDSRSIVLRLPYELAVDMLKHCPPSKDKDELMMRVSIAARRSKILTNLLQMEVNANVTDNKE